MKCSTCDNRFFRIFGNHAPGGDSFCEECWGTPKAKDKIYSSLRGANDRRLFIWLRSNNSPYSRELLKKLERELGPEALAALATPQEDGRKALKLALRRYDSDDWVPDARFLERFAQRVFESDQFLTALRTSLPHGEEDKNFGFDHIPFLLQSIEARRRGFEKSAQLFLNMTVFLGILFSVALIGFAYILVDDSAIGPNRTLKLIEQDLRLLDSQLLRVIKFAKLPLNNNQDFRKEYVDELRDNLQSLTESKIDAAKELSKDTVERLDISVRAFEEDADEEDFIKHIEDIRRELNNKRYTIIGDSRAQHKIDDAISAARRIEGFETEREEILANARSTLDELNKNLLKVNSMEGRGTGDLLKRIALGIVVTGFFAAILRYFAQLYREHLRQVIIAERDDMTVRRFYVAFKCSSEKNEERAVVIQEFMKDSVASRGMGDADWRIERPPKSQDDIVAEVMKILAKKI